MTLARSEFVFRVRKLEKGNEHLGMKTCPDSIDRPVLSPLLRLCFSVEKFLWKLSVRPLPFRACDGLTSTVDARVEQDEECLVPRWESFAVNVLKTEKCSMQKYLHQ